MVCDRELEKMAGNTLMPKDWSRVFNRGADIKIFRLRIVSRNEEETARILIVNTGWIHETAGTRWFKCFWQLSNLERAKIIGQRHEIVFLQKADHFLLAALIGFQERCLIRRNVRAARRVGISQFGIRQERLQCQIARQLRTAIHFHLRPTQMQ